MSWPSLWRLHDSFMFSWLCTTCYWELSCSGLQNAFKASKPNAFYSWTRDTDSVHLRCKKKYKPCHQDAGNIRSKSLSHFSAAHVSNTVQGQVHEGRVAAGQVILNAVIDETDQVTIRVHQHWDEQVTLKGTYTIWTLLSPHRFTQTCFVW